VDQEGRGLLEVLFIAVDEDTSAGKMRVNVLVCGVEEDMFRCVFEDA